MTTPFFDVRMRGFGARTPVAHMLALLDRRTAALGAEAVPAVSVAGRVLAEAVVSGTDVPGFRRAAMDGYAVRAAELPGPLAVVGEAFPGRPYGGPLAADQAVRVMTGAPVPDAADAVVRVEATRLDPDGRVVALEPAAAGRNVGRVGEDVSRGQTVLPVGRVLRPQDVGLLAAVGATAVRVVRRPRVAVLVTGDELLPPGSTPEGFRIVDSNSPMLAALAARDGAEVLPTRHVADRLDAVRDALATAVADVVLVSGGSSVGQEDHAPRAVADLGELAVHGVAVKPAGPSGVGFVGGRAVFLLPGNPVSCLCGYDLFAGRVVRRLGGRAWDHPYRQVTLPLAEDVASAAGRVDYVRVRVENGSAYPISAGASVLSSTVAADGFVLVDAGRTEIAAGEAVDVWLYDQGHSLIGLGWGRSAG